VVAHDAIVDLRKRRCLSTADFRWNAAMISTTNTTALQILKGLDSSASLRDAKAEWVRPPNHGPMWARAGAAAPIEPISQAAKDAITKIVAILGENGGSVDLSGETYTHASISARDNATIIGGPGNDSIGAGHHANVSGGDGSDSIGVWDHGKVDAGAGDDFIDASHHANIVAGDGNDWVSTYHYAKIDTGAGDDYVRAYRYAQVDGGAGNDEIRVNDHATVDAGDGDDLVVSVGGSTIAGGAGNDIIIATEIGSNHSTGPNNGDHGLTYGYNNIDGGEGDDYLQTTDNSTVRGGTGNDTIRLIGTGSTVNFAKGDGQDAILASEDFTLNIAGYSKDDVTVTAQGEELVVSFNGSEESISLNLSSGATARLAFEDGSSLDIAGNNASRALSFLWSKPDWAPEDPFYLRSASGRAY
jgi:Ca2+-binding RTX toxin-like protein